MTLIRPFILSAVAIAGSLSAYGNLVISNPAGTGAWYGPTTASQGSGAFWDQTSQDGTNCNVGFWLQSNNWSNVASHCSSSTFSGSSGPDKSLSFLAADAPTGGQGQAVGWTMNASGPQEQTVLRVEVAGNAGINTLGWYTISGGNAVNGGVIFTGSNSPNTTGSTISIAPGTQFGFYLCPAGCDSLATGTILTGSSYYLSGAAVGSNPSTTSTAGRFALFSEIPANPSASPAPGSDISKYWVGVEDQQYGNAAEGKWGDFNDMIFSVQVVPEPGFYGVLGLGLSALAYKVKRRKTAE